MTRAWEHLALLAAGSVVAVPLTALASAFAWSGGRDPKDALHIGLTFAVVAVVARPIGDALQSAWKYIADIIDRRDTR